MTNDEIKFQTEYRPGQHLTSDGVRTSLAQEKRKGRIVLVHELGTATESDRQRAQTLLEQLAPGDAAQIISTFEFDAGPVVVTKFLPGFTSFLSWLEDAAAGRSTLVSDSPGDRPTIEGWESGDADEPVIGTRPESPDTVHSLGSSATSPAADPAVPTALTPNEPSSTFTKLFGEPTPPPQAPQQSDTPGDFTRLFGLEVDSTPVSVPPKSVPSEGGLRSTRTADDTEQVPPAEPPSLVPEKRSGPSQPASAELSPVDDPATGNFTHLFGSPSSQGASPVTPPPVRPVPLDASPVSPAPGPVVRQPQASVQQGEMRSVPAAPSLGEPTAPPPRLRLDALDGSAARATPMPVPRPDSEANAAGPPKPFSVPPLLRTDQIASGSPSSTGGPFSTIPPDLRAPVRPPARSTSPDSVYTEVLTPARPPLNAGSARNPTPAPAPAPPSLPPRPSYIPLIAGLTVFVVLAVAFVLYFVMSS